MKNVFFTISLLFFTKILLAQGPGLSFSQTSGTYSPISSGTVLVSGTFDDINYPVTLPASFTFGGIAYTQVIVNTNGWIALGNTAPASNLYIPISTTTAVPGFIAPFGMDIENADGGAPEIRWEQSGNEIIFQWKDVKRYTSATNTEIFSFQLRLNTSTGAIQFVYGSFQNVTTSTSSPQVGIRTFSNTFPANIYNRLVNTVSPSDTWATSSEGVSNNSTCRISSTSPASSPATGQTYTWTPNDCTSLSCTSNISPVNGSNISTTSVNLSWSTVPGAASYKLYFGSSFPLALQGTYSGTSATVNSLLVNTTYSWYVVPTGFNCEVSGCETTVTSFNTVCPVLSCTSNISPANASTTVNANTTFTWNAVAGATNYDLYLGTVNPPAFYGNYTTTTAAILLIPGSYSWYVVPRFGSGCSIPAGCEASATTFTYSSTTPNDICQTATDLASVNGTVVSTTGGTSESLSFSGACAGTGTRRDIWYKFKAIATTASVSVSGSGSPCYDPGIQAFSGTCSALTCLGNDDAGSCSTLNTVSMSGLTVGNIYYIRIYTIGSGGGQFAVTGSNIGSTLPLSLISFSGSKQINDALLQWKTANEINVSHFEVQRSNDGQTFTSLGNVAAGSSFYSFTDANTFSSRTMAFYRLKSIDTDGRFTYSNIIKLSKLAGAALTVYPNPVNDVLTISGLNQNGIVILYSAEGKLLHQQTVSAQTMTMDMSKYAKGIYWLQYQYNGETVNQKIIKQ